MRLLSVISFSIFMLVSANVWSAPSHSVTEQRSAIEWLLSDLGAIFSVADEKLSSPSDSSPSVKQISVQPATNNDQDLFGEGNFDTPAVNTAAAPAPVISKPDIEKVQVVDAKPSIGDFFSDLFAFVRHVTDQAAAPQPVVEAMDKARVDALEPEAAANLEPELTSPAVEDAPTLAVETAQAPPEQSQFDLFAVLEQAAVAYNEAGDDLPAHKGKPLLSDFFASLSRSSVSKENVDAGANITGDETPDDHRTPPMSTVENPADGVASVAELSERAYAPNETVPENLERAPWQVTPHVAVFAPDADVLDDKHPAPVLTTPGPKAQVIPVEVSDTAPAIRKRQPRNPAARNHLSLGQSRVSNLPEDEYGFFDHLMETFVGENAESASRTEVLTNKIPDRIVPEESLDLSYTSPDAKPVDEPENELTTIGDGILKHVDLYLGQNTVIGHPYEPSAHASGTCIERAIQVSIFCVTEIAWPSEIASSFAQDTAFTLPGEGVIRYENGRVSRAYTPFKAGDFADVVKFMQRRFGPPLEREVIWMHMIEAPKMPNTTFRWRAVSADRKDAIVLEVRNFDDLRRSFADLNRGMVRLYRDGSRPIFKHLSTMDLMLIQRRRVTQAPLSTEEQPAAN